MPNPLAQMLRMTPQMEAYDPYYSEWMPQNPQQAQAYYPAIQALQGMQRMGVPHPATDSGLDNFLRSFTRLSEIEKASPNVPQGPWQPSQMMMRPGVTRQGAFGPDFENFQMMPREGFDPGENPEAQGWMAAQDFINEAAKFRDELPEPLRLKLDRVLGGK